MHERIDGISRDPNAPEPSRRPPQETPKRDTTPKPQEKQTQKPAAEPPTTETPENQNAPDDLPDAEEKAPETKPPELLDKKKDSPWKLVDKFKQRTIALEQELQTLRSQVKDPKEAQVITQRLTQAEQRVQELEQEMRYHDFTKTNEFRTQYQEPYEKAWKAAISDLEGISFADPVTGQERALNAQDLIDIVGLPLGKARALATQLYGDFANDVMTHRKSILDLYQKQQSAIEDARKNGGEHLKQRNQQMQQARAAIAQETRTAFEAATKKGLEDPKYSRFLTPIEGDEAGNQQLERGYKFVDEAFKLNPSDPRLSKEDRAKIAEKHAVVRHRAAAFGRMRSQLLKAEAKIAALNKELDGFRSSNPGGGEGQAQRSGEPSQGSARDRLMGRLEKISRPA